MQKKKSEHLYNQCLQECVVKLQQGFGYNLTAILLAGSLAKGTLVPGWSDIDLLILCRRINYRYLKILGGIKSRLEAKYGIHLGVSLVTPEGFATQRLETNAFKTRSIKQHFGLGKTKLIFGKLEKPYIPTKEDMARDACREISIYHSQLRKAVRDYKGLELLKRCIKLSFRVVRLALTHDQYILVSYSDTIAHAKKHFTDFPPEEFAVLEWADKQRSSLDRLTNEKVEQSNQRLTDFVESFVAYFFDRTANQ